MVASPAPIAAPRVFDRPLARRRLARALRAPGDDFLLARATTDLIDRLAPVQRRFEAILDVGTPRADASGALAEAFPTAALTRAAGVDDGARGRWASVTADEEALPFAPESFDLAVSLMALQGVNDLPGALLQLRRALKPDGLFLACLMGGQSLTELRTSLTAAEIELTGGASPRVAPFADLRDLGGLLQRAGFALPVTDNDQLTVRYSSIFGLLADLRGMGATNVLAERSRRPLTRTILVRAAAIYAERFSDPDGRLRATFDLVWLSGWSPHESQQKPARRGSAKVSLADALQAIQTARGES
jgi:SAM-dependent methyltransferase